MAGLLVAGTSSDAGKSLLVTGIAAALRRRGVSVAPFKAQNMSNNSMVCADGAEIGRAQYVQALAAGVEPSSLHNPVLLKPGTDRRSHVVLRGQPAGELHAGEYATGRAHLADAAFAAFAELEATHDVVIAEGAGSPAEINLRERDYVNMGLARRFGLPVAVVGDIDRGGVLASLYGTWAVLEEQDRALLKAFVINRFRGDASVLAPGLDEVTRRTGVPFAGVIPWLENVWLDGEDALTVGAWRAGDARSALEHAATPMLTVAVVRFPRTSNATDVDALAAEPGVLVEVTSDPEICRDADLLVLPGSRATASDLAWLRRRGIADVVLDRVDRGLPVLGICGGFQMLCESLDDEVESAVGRVPGLGVLPGDVVFHEEKVLGRPSGQWRGIPVEGYEIHHGVTPDDGSFPGGLVRGTTWGTVWHGALECDAFRRAWLAQVAECAGANWAADESAPGFADRRLAMIDTLGDAVETYVNLDLLLDLTRNPANSGVPAAAGPQSAPGVEAAPRVGTGEEAEPGKTASGTREVRVIGIGMGAPGHLTADAVAALAECDVFLVADKGEVKEELLSLRRALVELHGKATARFVTVVDPARGDDAARDADAYRTGVRSWHAARADAYAEEMRGLPEDAVVGFLVWGDPAFYDSTLRVVDTVAERTSLNVKVFPGVTAFSALAAAHGSVLHAIGEPVHVTTGRNLRAMVPGGEGWPFADGGGGTIVVMLDGALVACDLAERHPEFADAEIVWGAYVGMAQQELRSGRLADVASELRHARAALRERYGWVMDVYAVFIGQPATKR